MTDNGTTATTNRRTIDGVHVFQAPDGLVQNLQRVLVDLKQAWMLMSENGKA